MPKYNELGELEHSIPDDFLENKYAGWIWLALSAYLWSGGAYMFIANDWPPFWISMDRADDLLFPFSSSLGSLIIGVFFWGAVVILVATYGTYRGIKQAKQYFKNEATLPVNEEEKKSIDETLGWSKAQIIDSFGNPKNLSSIGSNILIGEWDFNGTQVEIWFRAGISYQINRIKQ